MSFLLLLLALQIKFQLPQLYQVSNYAVLVTSTPPAWLPGKMTPILLLKKMIQAEKNNPE